MRREIFTFFIAALFAVSAATAQQSPSPQPAPAQSAPCVNVPSNPANSPSFKTPNKWKQLVDKQRQRLQTAAGISVPDPTSQAEQTINARPVPCAPQPVAPAARSATVAPAAAVKLPPDVSVTLHCNPTTPSPKDGGGHPTTLTLPDPHDYAIPKATDFEVDGVVPDLAAKTPCYLVKVDPKTNKSFVQQ